MILLEILFQNRILLLYKKITIKVPQVLHSQEYLDLIFANVDSE